MSKKTKKQSIPPEMTQRRGCMPRLASMFNSRHAQLSRRLLSNKKHESNQNSDFFGNSSSSGKFGMTVSGVNYPADPEDTEGSASEGVTRSTSVRYLMAEEMSETAKVPKVNADASSVLSHDLEIRDQPSALSDKQKTEIFSHKSSLAGTLDRYSSNGSTKELAENKKNLIPSCSTVKPELDKASRKGGVSKKNFKLLEKWKSVQRPREETEVRKLQQKQIINRLFQKKQKPRNGEEKVDRVIALKSEQPLMHDYFSATISATDEGKDRFSSHFSLKEVKRKLKHTLQDYRRDHHVWFLGSILHTIPGKHQNFDDLNQRKSHGKEHTRQTKLKEKAIEFHTRRTNVASTSTLSDREYEFQREAKWHLATMLSTLNNDTHSTAVPSSSSPFGKILSLLGSNSQFTAPNPDMEKDSSASIPILNSNQGDGNILSTLEIIEDTASAMTSDRISKPTFFEQFSDQDYTLDSGSLGIESKLTVDERREEETYNTSEELEIVFLEPTTPENLLVLDMTSQGSPIEKPERPSPVSILDALFFEEDSSPENHAHKQGKNTGNSYDFHDDYPDRRNLPAVDFLGQVSLVQFDEEGESQEFPPTPGHGHDRGIFNDDKSTREYVWRILEASGFIQSENREKWHSSSPMLNPSFYNEVAYPSADFPDDLHLLFDSISEVLEQLRENFMEFSTKPNDCLFPSGDTLLTHVLNGVTGNCISQEPDSLEQIMEKELRMWMNLRPEIEDIGAILEDEILEDMIEEVMIELQFSAWTSTYSTMKDCSRSKWVTNLLEQIKQ